MYCPMKKLILFFMLFLGITVHGFAQYQSHSECRDPACLGLLASCSVSFVNATEVTIYVPKPPVDVIGINSPLPVFDWGYDGNRIKIVLRKSVTESGIALLDIVVNKRGTVAGHDYQCYYHVELNITKAN